MRDMLPYHFCLVKDPLGSSSIDKTEKILTVQKYISAALVGYLNALSNKKATGDTQSTVKVDRNNLEYTCGKCLQELPILDVFRLETKLQRTSSVPKCIQLKSTLICQF